MKKLIGERLTELIICVVIFSISACFFGLVRDDYSYFASSLAARQFCDFAYFDLHFQGFIGIREVYKLLYYCLPQINWHFIFSILYEILTLYMVLRTLRVVILKNLKPELIISIQVLAALFFIENIVFVSHTRVSLIFCGMALLNLAFTKDISKRSIILNSTVFIFGMLLRPESSIGSLLLVCAGYIVYYFNPWQLIKRIWLPVLGLAVFMLVFMIDLAHTDTYVRKIEPEIEYKLMARRIVDIGQMTTHTDSVKYEAGTSGLWFDTKVMSPDYLRTLLVPGSDLSYAHMREVFKHVGSLYSGYPFIYCSLVVLLLMCGLLKDKRILRLSQVLAFTFFTFAIIYALDYNGFLVCSRHFFNLQIISLFVICFYVFDGAVFHESRYIRPVAIAALVFLLGTDVMTVMRYKEKSAEIAIENNEIVKTMNEFERRHEHQIVAVTIPARFMLDRPFALTNEIYSKNTYLMFDWFTFDLTPRYADYLSRTCGCDVKDPKAFFQWMSDSHALYMAVPDRFDLTERYMEAVHGCKLRFVDPVRVNSLMGIDNPDTRDVEVRTVTIEK